VRLPPDSRLQSSAGRAWPLPDRPRNWLTIRRAGTAAAPYTCDGWDAVIAMLPELSRGVYHVRHVESDQVVAIVTRRAGGWDLSSWRMP
jgi:hypothetical protein